MGSTPKGSTLLSRRTVGDTTGQHCSILVVQLGKLPHIRQIPKRASESMSAYSKRSTLISHHHHSSALDDLPSDAWHGHLHIWNPRQSSSPPWRLVIFRQARVFFVRSETYGADWGSSAASEATELLALCTLTIWIWSTSRVWYESFAGRIWTSSFLRAAFSFLGVGS